jgi:hypothetical protein
MAHSVICSVINFAQIDEFLAINVMHRGGEVLVNEIGVSVADRDIAIGSVADRCLLRG